VRAVAAHADPRLFPLADSHVPRLVDSSRRAHALRCTVAALPPLPCSQPPREHRTPSADHTTFSPRRTKLPVSADLLNENSGTSQQNRRSTSLVPAHAGVIRPPPRCGPPARTG